jgi:quercetin dioxygenase-like cupin family protein
MAVKYTYPHTIESGGGEKITFQRAKDAEGEYLEVEAHVAPGAGPPMHVHFLQDESLTVIQGKIGTQTAGQPPQYHGEGHTATFKRGVPHKFWNAGDTPLICRGWVRPIDNMEYFLTELYKSTKANGGKRPGMFDSAYLLQRYKSEFDMLEIPPFVKKFILPLVVSFGTMMGWHKKFADAPEPVQ